MSSTIRLPIEEGRIQLLWLTNPNTSLVCDKLLRNVPGKRWVCLAHWGEQIVVARLFTDYKDAQCELKGAQALLNSQIKTPAVLYHGWTSDKSLYVVLFEYVESGQELQVVWQLADDAARTALLRSMVMLLTQLHKVGLQQTDLQFKNFSLKDNEIYIIDVASIAVTKNKQGVTERAGLKNLGLLFAQLSPRYDALCATFYPLYVKHRNLPFTLFGLKRLKKSIAYWRRQRLLDWGRKVFQSGYGFIVRKNRYYFSVCDRGYDTDAMRALLERPDYVLNAFDVASLKSGSGSTVSKVVVDGRAFVIKCYNQKNIWRQFLQMFFASKAKCSWRNAQCLKLLDIATPKPVAMVEKRFGPLRFESYFITEYVAGANLQDYFSDENLVVAHTSNQLTSLAENMLGLFADLSDAQISHGNLCATNILLSQMKPTLLDLDAMRLHRYQSRWYRAAKRDRERFMQNWRNHPEIQRVFHLIGSEVTS